jgi:ATP-dependent DNA helicase RecG
MSIDERPAVPWEEMATLGLRGATVDADKAARFTAAIRASDRVKAPVKEKSDEELLAH